MQDKIICPNCGFVDDAKTVLVSVWSRCEFTDYVCPACKRFSEVTSFFRNNGNYNLTLQNSDMTGFSIESLNGSQKCALTLRYKYIDHFASARFLPESYTQDDFKSLIAELATEVTDAVQYKIDSYMKMQERFIKEWTRNENKGEKICKK